MVILEHSNLKEIRDKHKGNVIICCTGTFDLTHAGHILFFEDCKKEGDILVVSVARDSLVRGYKGEKRPILNESIRLKTIDSIKCVDYATLDCNKTWGDHYDTLAPLFRNLRPDLYIVNEDAIDIEKRKKIATEFGVKVKVLKRMCPKEFDGISTSKIISKISTIIKEN